MGEHVPETARVFRFEAAELETIKKAATPAEPGAWVSTFEALSAHIHPCVWNARYGSSQESGSGPAPVPAPVPAEAKLLLANNFRRRVPHMPAHYVGNCNILSPVFHSTTGPAGAAIVQRLATDLPWLASQVRVALVVHASVCAYVKIRQYEVFTFY